MSVNKVILLGHVGSEPEIREGNGGKFATFRIATTDKGFTRRDGTQVPERTEWHNIVANGPVVQIIESYVRKGTKLYVEGKLRTRKYTDRNGQERTVTEIALETLELCGGKAETSAPAQNPNPPFMNERPAEQLQAPAVDYDNLSFWYGRNPH